MQALAEKYRPKDWAEVVGQERALKKIATLRPRGLSGRAFWIAGRSGTGKTTIARLLAQEVASDFSILELDAGELSAARVRELEGESSLFGMGGKPGRAYIVNEAHGLRSDAMRALLVALERIPPHVIWIFTTTADGEEALFEDHADTGPLLSRCILVPLSQTGLAEPFAERARAVAIAEGIDGLEPSAYLTLARKHRNNLRAMLQAVETGDIG